MLKKSLTFKILLYIFSALVCAGAGIFLYFHKPGTTDLLPGCFLYETTSIYCPGCGGTRAVYALLHGDILLCLRNNIMLFPMLGAAIVLSIKPGLGLNVHFSRAVTIAVIAFMILRNIPFFPFTLLAPILV